MCISILFHDHKRNKTHSGKIYFLALILENLCNGKPLIFENFKLTNERVIVMMVTFANKNSIEFEEKRKVRINGFIRPFQRSTERKLHAIFPQVPKKMIFISIEFGCMHVVD